MYKHFTNSHNDEIVAAASMILSGKTLNEEQKISGKFKFYASEKDYIESEAATQADQASADSDETFNYDDEYEDYKSKALLNVYAYTGTDDAKYGKETGYHNPKFLITPETFEKYTNAPSKKGFLYGYNNDEDVMFSYDPKKDQHYFYTRNGKPLKDLGLF